MPMLRSKFKKFIFEVQSSCELRELGKSIFRNSHSVGFVSSIRSRRGATCLCYD